MQDQTFPLKPYYKNYFLVQKRISYPKSECFLILPSYAEPLSVHSYSEKMLEEYSKN